MDMNSVTHRTFAAPDMKVLGGIPPVVEQLEAQEGNLRALAAYVLGTAASNNPHFQNDLLELYPDIFSRLRQVCVCACVSQIARWLSVRFI